MTDNVKLILTTAILKNRTHVYKSYVSNIQCHGVDITEFLVTTEFQITSSNVLGYPHINYSTTDDELCWFYGGSENRIFIGKPEKYE